MFRWLKKKYQKNNEPSTFNTCRRLSFPDVLNHEVHFKNMKELDDKLYHSYANLSTESKPEHIYAEIDDRGLLREAPPSSEQELSLFDVADDEYEEFSSVHASPFRAVDDANDGYLVPLKSGSSVSEENVQVLPTYFVVTPEKDCSKESVNKPIMSFSKSKCGRKMHLNKRKEVKSWHGNVDPIFAEDDQWKVVTDEFVFQLDTVATVERTPSKLSSISRKLPFWKKTRTGSEKCLSFKEKGSSKKKSKNNNYPQSISSLNSSDSSDLSDEIYYCEIGDVRETAIVFQDMPYFNPRFGFGLNKWYHGENTDI